MIADAKSKHGGWRANAGRKRNPLKELRTGALTAARMLRELREEDEIKRLYRECGDVRLQAHMLFRLREWAYGKPTQPQEEKVIFDPKAPLRVLIEHIGTKNPAAAQAK